MFTLYDASHILLWGVILWYNEITLGVLISRCTMDPTHSFGEFLFYDVKYPVIAYLTLQNDSNTACNTVSLILNASILQHEIITPGVISWYHKIASLSQLKKSNYLIKGLPTIYFIILTVLTDDCPDNGIANTYVYYQWDRIAWCISVIFQREVSTPRVISLHHGITPHAYECMGVILQHRIRTPGIFHHIMI